MLTRIFAAAFAAAIAATGAAPALFAQIAPRPEVGAPAPFHLPETRRFTLDNGLEVVFVPFGLTPKVVVSVRVGAGNIHDGESTWLADLTGAMMQEGAAGRSAAEVARAAASMGGGLNVGVGLHETQFTMNILSEHGADAVALIADMIRSPDFPEAELDRVRANLLRNVSVARSQPGSIASEAYAEVLFGPAHPYGRMLPRVGQLESYTIDNIRDFHSRHFGAGRTRIYVAGRFDDGDMESSIRAVFGDWERGEAQDAAPAAPQYGPVVQLIDRPGAPQATIRLGFPAIGPRHADAIPLTVMNALLGGSFTSRLTQNLREDKGWTYSPGSGVSHVIDGGYWTFNADVTSAYAGPALSETFSEISRLQFSPPPTSEADGIRTWLSGTFVLQNASNGGLINQLSFRDLHGLPEDYLDTYVPRVLAVSDAQISEMARRYLPLDRMVLVVVGDLAVIEDQIRILQELEGARFIGASGDAE